MNDILVHDLALFIEHMVTLVGVAGVMFMALVSYCKWRF
ncbi:hypothetical protein SmphiM6_112 [Sinorhizobium phage phiM6]|nr:hypothetical protein SmphiM6_112 [Sinorhizobium phage phiM6]